jgi:hypothetical protein
VIVYATFPTDTDHRYRYARWDGSRWIDRELVPAGGSMSVDPSEPNYSGGITLNHDDPSTVYLSRQVNGSFEIEVWTTRDRGATWSWRPLTSPGRGDNYRPISPRGQRGDDMDIVWMHGAYPSFTTFRTALRTQLRARANAGSALVQTLPPIGALLQAAAAGAPLARTGMRVTGSTTVMADPHPRSAPIPINEAAQAAD